MTSFSTNPLSFGGSPGAADDEDPWGSGAAAAASTSSAQLPPSSTLSGTGFASQELFGGTQFSIPDPDAPPPVDDAGGWGVPQYGAAPSRPSAPAASPFGVGASARDDEGLFGVASSSNGAFASRPAAPPVRQLSPSPPPPPTRQPPQQSVVPEQQQHGGFSSAQTAPGGSRFTASRPFSSHTPSSLMPAQGGPQGSLVPGYPVPTPNYGSTAYSPFARVESLNERREANEEMYGVPENFLEVEVRNPLTHGMSLELEAAAQCSSRARRLWPQAVHRLRDRDTGASTLTALCRARSHRADQYPGLPRALLERAAPLLGL
jgi:hypothetical protein